MIRRLYIERRYCPTCDGLHWHASKDHHDYFCIRCAGKVVGKLGEDSYIFYRKKTTAEGR